MAGGSRSTPNDTNQVLTAMTDLLGQLVERVNNGNGNGAHPEDPQERFRRQNPREFHGTTDPVEAENWIKSLEMIFEYLRLADIDRPRCAAYMLRGDALMWWESAKLTVDLATLSWADFRELFLDHFFTDDMRSELHREFFELKQGDTTVREYASRFERGCYYVPLIGNNAQAKMRQFIGGLRPTIRHDVNMTDPVNYQAAVDKAMRSERNLKAIEDERRAKRQLTQASEARSAKRQATGPSAVGPVRGSGRPPCKKCGKPHAGECLFGQNVCYRCGEPGHIASRCPRGATTTAKVNAITVRDDPTTEGDEAGN